MKRSMILALSAIALVLPASAQLAAQAPPAVVVAAATVSEEMIGATVYDTDNVAVGVVRALAGDKGVVVDLDSGKRVMILAANISGTDTGRVNVNMGAQALDKLPPFRN